MNERPPHDHHDTHDLGLRHDLPRLVGRRSALRLFAGAGVLAVATACGTSSSGSGSSPTTSARPASGGSGSSGAGASSAGGIIPTETAGPYPANGDNGPDVLRQSGVVRRDIRRSFGSASGIAAGILLTIELALRDSSAGDQPLAGASVYLWQCDRDGDYSMYTGSATDENYLRGVQEADADGVLRFESIVPAAYPGRWPHAHFEVYPDLATATASGDPRVTSQLALPEDVCDAVYATDGYEQSARNMARLSLSSDMVFRDGVDRQLATVTGSVDDGYLARLEVLL